MEQNKDKSHVTQSEEEVKSGQDVQGETNGDNKNISMDTSDTQDPVKETVEEKNQEEQTLAEEQDVQQLREKLEETEAELASAKEQLMRMQAEFINFRKRKEKEMLDTIRFANEELIKTLLPIVDNFDRTLDAIEKTDNLTAIKDGIRIVDHSMKHQLEKIGVKPIDCLNKDFDAQYHDAISCVPVEEEEKKGKVIDEVEKGYMLKDKVIRFSKVIVGE